MDDASEYIRLATDIVCAFVSNNNIGPADLLKVIRDIHGALRDLDTAASPGSPDPEPAVPIKKSVTPDYIICLEDGKKFKSLRRHLKSRFAMTPDQYREKWGLPFDYPMVAPNYAKARSALALKMGLGQSRKAPRKSKRSG